MNNRELVAAAKANLALAEKEVAKWKAVLAAFGESTPTGTAPGRKKPANAKQKEAIAKAQQARADSVAVKKGTATIKQLERHNARLAAKGAAAPAGASLVPSAAD